LGDDKKSMAIKVVLQSEEKTLDENDINSLSSKIVEAIEKSTSGTVRS
jgi:phenylalanyl-tRNA synthetase beta chain